VAPAAAATTTCAPATGRYVTCHRDRGRWARQWSNLAESASSLVTSSRCAVCHGSFVTGWRLPASGPVASKALSDHRRANVQNTGNHDDCRYCHVYSSGVYAWGTLHDNGSMAMNAETTTIAYNGTTGSCAQADGVTGCHGGAAHPFALNGVGFVNTRFPLEKLMGPAGSCNSCHTTNLLTHLDANESTAAHNTQHRTRPYIAGGCVECHPNAGPGVGTGHQDDAVAFSNKLAGLASYKAVPGSFAVTNCNAANKCHDSAAGEWKAASLGTDSCVACHLAAGKTMLTAPGSALHVVTVAGVKAHNASLFRPTVGRTGCEVCHGPNPSSSHFNGTVEPANVAFATSTVQAHSVAGTPTCAPKSGRYVSCHTDDGRWARQWSNLAESASSTYGAPRCAVCHGDFVSGWRNVAGVGATTAPSRALSEHRKPNIANTARHEGCKMCHNYGDASYAWTRHDNGSVAVNMAPSVAYTSVGNVCNGLVCHGNDTPAHAVTGVQVTPFPLERFVGPPASCAGCHGNAGSGQTWPTGLGGVYYDNQKGKHDSHVLAVSQYKYGLNLANLLSAGASTTYQRAICAYCHPNPGAPNHTANTGTAAGMLNRANVASAGAGSFRKFIGGGAEAPDTLSGVYNTVGRTCLTLVCHNQVTTTSWETGPVASCTLCHPSYPRMRADGGIGREAHAVHTSVKGYGCVQCHPVPAGTSFAHQNGRVKFALNVPGT